MILTGTVVNVAAISPGALIGRYAGRFNHLTKEYHQVLSCES